MIWHHGIPWHHVVSFLLLLCFTHSGLGENCVFTEELLPTTNISNTTKKLKELLLLDYPVSLPSNLMPDKLCFELWGLHFIFRELSRMQQVAGLKLRKDITDLEMRMNLKELFEECQIESDCVDFERSNVSMFLDSIPRNFEAMQNKMAEPATNFSSCISVRCRPGTSWSVSMEIMDSLSTPYPGYSSQILGNIQPSKSAVLQRHHWLLIPIPVLVCLFGAVKFSSWTQSRQLLPQV